MADVTLPQLGETVTEGTITRWFKKVGESVKADEPLFEVSTDKVDTEVPSPISGTVLQILAQEGDTVPVGQAEAARSLGFTFTQNLRMILLPQAFRAVVIPLGSVLIALTKNTTIASAIGVAEAALLMKEMTENTAALIAVGAIFAAGFIALTLPLGLLFGWLGKRLAVAR